MKILQGGNTDQAAEIKNLKGQLMHYVAEQFRHEGELEDEVGDCLCGGFDCIIILSVLYTSGSC